MKSTVLVFGGGVAGMSAAHELMRRGFQVTVLEATETAGGKARSTKVARTGTEGRRSSDSRSSPDAPIRNCGGSPR